MIRTHYLLSQEICCGAPGNFTIHETSDEDNRNDQQSGFSELNFTPQNNVGKFQQTSQHSICCCSCKSIKQLSLQMYGQRLSQSSTQTSCCFNICRGQLLVLALNKVIIGKIRKTCSSWCSSSVLVVLNQSDQQIFFIRMKCCQPANFLPRIFRYSFGIDYEIVDQKGIIKGTIKNCSTSCSASLFSLRDDFFIQFISVEKEKEKILLLNAVVFLNQMRHQWF